MSRHHPVKVHRQDPDSAFPRAICGLSCSPQAVTDNGDLVSCRRCGDVIARIARRELGWKRPEGMPVKLP